MAKTVNKKESAPKEQVSKPEVKVEVPVLDHSKEYKVTGTGKRADIKPDAEYLVSGQVAEILIRKGFAKLA